MKYCECNRGHHHRHHSGSTTRHSSPPSRPVAGFQSASTTYPHGYAAYPHAPYAFGSFTAPVVFQGPRTEQVSALPAINRPQSPPVIQPESHTAAQPTYQSAAQQAAPNMSHNSGSNNNGWGQTSSPTKEATFHLHQSSPVENSNLGGGWGCHTPSPPVQASNSPAQQPTPPAVAQSPQASWGIGRPDSPKQSAPVPMRRPSPVQSHAPSGSINASGPDTTKAGYKKKPAWNIGGPPKPNTKPAAQAQKTYWGDDGGAE